MRCGLRRVDDAEGASCALLASLGLRCGRAELCAADIVVSRRSSGSGALFI